VLHPPFEGLTALLQGQSVSTDNNRFRSGPEENRKLADLVRTGHVKLALEVGTRSEGLERLWRYLATSLPV
jgi:hypothetical protein